MTPFGFPVVPDPSII
ncbi:hypothetical protein CGLO_13580 [Colletotrichum gloeosporioides Cg-14]|uniref:Uncharacterized protein n=1 Tax=Colletotrichum gloeosporioides (strain Cg-14) TaxID=1237896 RepID=T0K3E3_COLGC|nr:hypothetical protein CGLO_13580 [Colletotrichum gloeosporioides Cg-14]